jgi:Putative restriction endonuclease
MPAVDLDDQPFIDPDELKMPESPEHRRVADLIGAAAEILMPDRAVYRDMNWYPPDSGNAVAPDVMVLPAGSLPERAKSYRQSQGGPTPSVVVEIASDSDSYAGFLSKTARYQRLGVPTYSVTIEQGAAGVIRFAESPSDFHGWIGVAIPELGDIAIVVVDGAIAVRLPDGRIARSAADMVSQAMREVSASADRAVSAERRASDAETRAATLAAKLRALGIDPDEV